MGIKKIKVSNFKSFRELEIELNQFNVFIGANAAGKSSFIQVFDFIRDIIQSGLSNAISMQGGVEYLRNIKIGDQQPLKLEIIFDRPNIQKIEKENENNLLCREAYESKYQFAIEFNGEDYKVIEDQLTLKFKYYEVEKQNKIAEKTSNQKELGEVILTLLKDNNNLDIKINKDTLITDQIEINRENILPSFVEEISISSKELILETPFAFIIERSLREILGGISIYNINPLLSKKATPITGKAELEEDGENLAIVLKNIIENRNKARKFTNIVKDILPFVNNIDIEKFADKSLLFKLKEEYSEKEYIPASILSDGTISTIALVIALYFEDKKIAIIEEPERNIHPHLISKLVDMFVDASANKQILITTHNPELIKYIDLRNLFLVHRDPDGFSKITKPVEKKEVQVFLDNDMGIDDLYIQNLLGV
ncbi:putative ATPase [Halanaerobium saccharolyticum]|uniref:Putative ATPase n=1 Tax=Halanaerobium saccharolyticum TaxID=43595 RepID=A0A4R7Z284_9FIRM|nr:AAA family ATPase [Halanaerobium saccharolyticum]RAK07500.1 putative ATPase [Halanaerobium saccharolyticum]TDW03077.1 putative ATPase [Halanaerobium saccharolyticum]TDX59373.1 putative ATPase [Halanaerobium saccharolyticum]